VRWVKRADSGGRLLGRVEGLSVLAGTQFKRREQYGRGMQEGWRVLALHRNVSVQVFGAYGLFALF